MFPLQFFVALGIVAVVVVLVLFFRWLVQLRESQTTELVELLNKIKTGDGKNG